MDYYPINLIVNQRSHFTLWGSAEHSRDDHVLTQNNIIQAFDTLKYLLQCTRYISNIQTSNEFSIYNLDTLYKWGNNSDKQEISYGDLLDAWNILADCMTKLSNQAKKEFIFPPHHIYSLLCYKTLSEYVLTEEGQEYIKTIDLNDEDTTELKRILTKGIDIVSTHIQLHLTPNQ